MIFEVWSLRKSIKIDPKSMPKRIQKKASKKSRTKFDFGSILASQNLLKSLRKPRKSLPEAMSNEACFATLCKLPRSRRKSTGIMVCKASKWLGIWLGLLDLPLVALIIKANHQRKFLDIKVHHKNFGLSAKLMPNPSKIPSKSFPMPSKIR